MATQRASSSYYVAATALLVAIGAFVVLAVLVIRSPQHLPLFQVDAPTRATCLQGSGADACFNLEVHNVGNAPGFVLCSVAPAAGTSSLFHSGGLPNANGAGAYQPSATYTSSTAVQPGQGLTLIMEVKADKGTKPAQPSSLCQSIPAPVI